MSITNKFEKFGKFKNYKDITTYIVNETKNVEIINMKKKYKVRDKKGTCCTALEIACDREQIQIIEKIIKYMKKKI